jgi:FAD/FMN-containing dehydrogenase
LLLGAGGVAGALFARSLDESPAAPGEPFPAATSGGNLLLNDASELSPTQVARHLTIRDNPDDMLLAKLRRELKDAQAARKAVVAHTARHSMGGQSLAADGVALTLDQNWIAIDRPAGVYRVAAGMRWSAVIKALDAAGLSPKVMQSNNDFGVASTFSVNAHGWPVTFSGGGTTARSMKILLASGEHLTCSRTENPRLFAAALGGYGLVGLITELEMEARPNRNLEPTFEAMRGKDFGLAFERALRGDPAIDMAYGRMNVAIDGFFDEALLITYRPTGDQSQIPPAAGSGFISRRSRDLFRQQVGSDRWKKFRWGVETDVNRYVNAGVTTRNSLLNEPVVTLDDRDPARTDILHEYFISPRRFAEFVAICQDVIPSSFQELLNITLRFVDTDKDSILAYATEPRIAAVMLFSQEKSRRAEADMARLTVNLIEGVLSIGGTYYLPYRPHASLTQFQRGYPRAGELVHVKQEVDPSAMFRNGLWENYLARL